jgi:hypothetical protein
VKPSALRKNLLFIGHKFNQCRPYLLDFNLNKKDFEDSNIKNGTKRTKKYHHTHRKMAISNAYSFDKYSKRPDLFGDKKKENRFAPIYYPDYNYCKKRITTHVIPFNKTTGRFYKTKSPATYKSPVFVSMIKAKNQRSIANSKKNNHVDFKKQLGRVSSSDSKLPCFMQMTGHSRHKIGRINAKSLKENNFCNRDYLEMRSTLN